MFKRLLRYSVFQGIVTIRFYTGSTVELKNTPGTAVVDMLISLKEQCLFGEDIFKILDVSKFPL
jgi:hypothetical protein